MSNTHMPFMAKHGDETISLCCRKIDGHWKIHRLVDEQWTRVSTGLEEDATECSPTAEFVNGNWNISFIAGAARNNFIYKLYRKKGEEPAQIVANPAAAGFVRAEMTAFTPGNDKIIIARNNWPRRFLSIAGIEIFHRISYEPDAPDRLLVSGTLNGELMSLIVDLPENKLFKVIADGNVAYKCAFFEGKCFYALQTGDGFEDREIREAESVEIIELPENSFSLDLDENNYGIYQNTFNALSEGVKNGL